MPAVAEDGSKWPLSLQQLNVVLSIPQYGCARNVLLELNSRKEREIGCLCRAVHGGVEGMDAITLRGSWKYGQINQFPSLLSG